MKKAIPLILITLCSLLSFNSKSQTGAWTALTSGTTISLMGVSVVDNNISYVSGSSGKILKTIDGGATWTSLVSGTSEDLYSICFTDANNGIAVGNNGALRRTTDGGTTWSGIFLTSNPFRRIYFYDANTGYITGGKSGSGSYGSIYKTSDGGASWTPLSITSSSVIYDIKFTSSTIGYACDFFGEIFKTTNAGGTWSLLSSGTSNALYACDFPSATNGIVVGISGVIRRTTNSGSSWTGVVSGTTDYLTGLKFYDANNGFAVGGDVVANTGTILSTTDGGNTWSIYTPGTSRLYGVDFLNSNLGYAVGVSGTILKYSAPIISTTVDARFTSSEPGCLGQLENFYSIMAGTTGITHAWNFGSGASPATSTSENPAGVVYSTSGAKLVTHIVSNGSVADTTISIITINPSPTASFTSNAPVCASANIKFTNSGSTGAGVTYSWDFGADANPSFSTAQNPSGIYYNTSGTKSLTLTVTNQYGCVISTSQTININALPVVNAGTDATICADASIQIGAPAIFANTYSWSPASTLSNANIANPISNPIAAQTSYILSVANTLTGCINHDTINVTMLTPLIANAGIDGAICKNNSFQLGSGLIEGQLYSWSPSAGLSDSTLSNPAASPDSTITYTLSVNQNGCQTVTDEVTIIVHSLPIVNAGADDSTTVGANIQLNATGGVQYMWSPSMSLNNAGIYNPIASPKTTTEYIVTATDVYECINADTVLITVLSPSLWLPTAFTPNGDGNSDVFYVRGEGIQNFEFTIFNRWGEQIFKSNNINIGWNGSRQIGGEELPEGAYVYYVKGSQSNGETLNFNGLVNLIR